MDAALHLLPVELVDRLFRLVNNKSRRALMLTCRRLAFLGKTLPWTHPLGQTAKRRIPPWVISAGPFHDRIDGARQVDPRATDAQIENPPWLLSFKGCSRLTRVALSLSARSEPDFKWLPPSVHTLCLHSNEFRVMWLDWPKTIPPTVRHLEMTGRMPGYSLSRLPPTVVSVKFLKGLPWFGELPATVRLILLDLQCDPGQFIKARRFTNDGNIVEVFCPGLVAIVASGLEREQIGFAPNLEHFSQKSEDWERFKAMF